MDKEPHRREPPEYAPPGQEYAQPGRECADPGWEQQGERIRATDYASPRQEKNRSEREKLLRTMLLGTATVAVAATVAGTPTLKPAVQDDHYVVVNMTHEVEADGSVVLEYHERHTGFHSLPAAPCGYRDGNPSCYTTPYSDLQETILNSMNYYKEHYGDDSYYYDAEKNLMVNPRPCIFTYYAVDAPTEAIYDKSKDDRLFIIPGKWECYYIDPALWVRGATIVVRVDYPLGNDYYRDEYQYNLATGEFTQTMDGQWTMQFDKYYDTKPVSEVHQSTAAESE